MKFHFFSVFFFFLLCPQISFAESIAPFIDCRVGVRVVKGSQREHGASRNQFQIKLNSFLSDVQSQLEQVPFLHYEVLQSIEKKVQAGEKGTFQLKDVHEEEHVLVVVPHEFDEEGVHLTVDWDGPKGEEMLSARMRVPVGKNVVLGTDTHGDMSTIMCIKVQCQ